VAAADRADPNARLRTVSACLLVLSALLASALPRDLAALARGSCAERRAAVFQSVPVDAIDAALDRHLGPERRVALGPALAGNDFLVQRLAEAIHPRLVDARAPHVVDAAIDRSGALEVDGVALARMGDAVFVLRGPIDRDVRPAVVPARSPAWVALRFAAIAIGICGLGLALTAWLARRARPSRSRS
jgi:hypothetical protein